MDSPKQELAFGLSLIKILKAKIQLPQLKNIQHFKH